MTTEMQENECTVFNCSGMYSTHSKCARTKAPDFREVLQNHSINSLIARGVLRNNRGTPKKDMFGLNSPRGLLGGTFVSDARSGGGSGGGGGIEKISEFTPSPPTMTSNPIGFMFKNNDKLHQDHLAASRRKAYAYGDHTIRSGSLSDSFQSTRSTSLSDCSGSNSPSVFEPYYNGNLNNFGTDSDNSAVSSPDGSLTEILNSLTLNESFAHTSSPCVCKLKLKNLQNVQANGSGAQHCSCNNYLQQSPSLLSTSVCSLNSPNILDKFGGDIGNNQYPSFASKIRDNSQLDRAARFHRSAAAVYDATCTWSGILPERTGKHVGFSSKVFLGGVPWDITEQLLAQTFKPFGPVKVEWPGKEKHASQPKGYVYVIFESEKEVRALLQACTADFSQGDAWYYKMSSKRMRAKSVQVIPWYLNDANYTKSPSQKLDPSRTVFVGALHGMLNAEGLANIMNDLFDGVVYAGIDTDKYKYPIGSGRVTFNNSRSYMKAVAAAFVEIKTGKFSKKVQVDPYLEDSLCSICGVQQGPYFCRELTCFRYFCRGCWALQHCWDYRLHKPLMRNSKNSMILGLGGNNSRFH